MDIEQNSENFNNATVNEYNESMESPRRGEEVEKLDVRIITFSLDNKDYAIDIMKVSEISKASRFTYVPNSEPYVRGVYNLRGDIISVLDLRKMFNLSISQDKDGKEGGEEKIENMLILDMEEYQVGVIVDFIDRVINISSNSIQPPHPLFGGINVRYISGIVENGDRLYIILDVDRIFSVDDQSDNIFIDNGNDVSVPVDQAQEMPAEQSVSPDKKDTTAASRDYQFVCETLATFVQFNVSEVNSAWTQRNFGQWKQSREAAGKSPQLENAGDAESFLKNFYSIANSAIWPVNYLNILGGNITDSGNNLFNVWDIGCASGHEAYSIACLINNKFPDKRLKVWAHDKDLLAISNAPSVVCPTNSIDEFYQPYMDSDGNNSNFKQQIKESVVFEYHDVMNKNTFPKVDMVVARDVLSFYGGNDLSRLIAEIKEKLLSGGLLVLGDNEKLPGSEQADLTEITASGLSIYRRN